MSPLFRCIYEEFGDGQTPDWWAGVDVRREDGVLQHGTLVDVSSSGLVVDMGCAGQRQQLVPYGEAFQFLWGYSRVRNIPVPGAVLVLLRDTRDSPWVWQSATFRAIFSSSEPYHAHHGLALVALHAVPNEVVVAWGQLRVPPSPEDLQALAIQQGDFVRRKCALPDYGGWRPADDSPVWQVGSRAIRYHEYFARPLFVDGDWLVYLQLADADPVDCETLKRIIDGAQGAVAKCKQAKGVHYCRGGWRCCEFPRRVLAVEADAAQLLHVPAEALVEVFQHSSSMDRVQHRRVCRRFNGILTETQFKDIIIRCGTCPVVDLEVLCRHCGKHRVAYAVIASIVKCLTRSVKHVIVTDDPQEQGPSAVSLVLEVVQSLSTLALAGHGPLVVVAGNCELVRCNFSREVQYLAIDLQGASRAGMCSALLLHKCTVRLSRSRARVRVSGVVGADSAEVDLWKAVEKSVPVVDVPPIAAWVSRAAVERSDDRKEIRQVLGDFAGDPRASSDDDCMDNLADLPVTKLSVLCRYVLSLLTPPNGPNVFLLLPFPEDP